MNQFYLLLNFLPVVLKKRTAAIVCPLLFFISVSAQITNISGIVNTYHKVIEIIPAKACVRVTNVAALSQNKKVIIIQMKGASINTTNSSAFGDTTTLNQAGNYEVGTICYIIGDSVFLFHNLLNTYDYSAGKVQLVNFAEYYSASVVDTVKATSWDSAAGTGGVIAISAEENLTLNAPVFADSSGYSGGRYLLSTGGICLPAPNYIYNPTSTNPQNGAYKGEGVANMTTAISGGRGAPANGGGGGNYHNNGGGGGANLSAGGIGGGNSSTVGCLGTFQGVAGKALNSWNGKKIFPGGGGGAGHVNFVSGPTIGGGNGGGIIFIQANNLTSNGYWISAGGAEGGPAISDGASGGGAGGTIIINVLNSFTDNVFIRANGGNGGTEDDGGNSGRCYGAGGGGSGGVIYFTGALPTGTITASGGSAGPELSPSLSCNTLVLPGAGSPGFVISNYTYSRSFDEAGYCRVLLPVQLTGFIATPAGKKVFLQWWLQTPGQVKRFIIERSVAQGQWSGWKAVEPNDQIKNYTAVDENPFPGTTFYRIKIIEKNNSIGYSPIRRVNMDLNETFSIYPNPAKNKIFIVTGIPSSAELKLLDIFGKIILQKKLINSQTEINLDSVPAGIYLVNINGTTRELIVQ